MKEILSLIVLLFLATNSSAALTVGNIPKVKTGGATPAIENSSLSESGGNLTTSGTLTVNGGTVTLGGTGALNGLDSIDSTTETTLEGALDVGGDVLGSGLSNIGIVNKAVRIDEIENAGTNVGQTFGAFTNTWTSSAGDAAFFKIDTGTTDVVVRGDGNVGIGTTDPGAELHIVGNVTFGSFTSCTALETDGSGVLTCGSDGGGGTTPRYDEILDAGTHSGLVFGSFTNTWTSSAGDAAFFKIAGSSDFVVRGDGNVGVGTSDPSAALHIVGTGIVSVGVSTPLLDLIGTGTINGLDVIDSTTETTLEGALDLAGDVSSTGLSNTIIGNKAIRYDEIGNAGTHAGLVFGSFSNLWTSSAGDAEFFKIDTGTNDFVVRGDGNTGIGTTDPATVFHVVGTPRFASFTGCNLDTDGNGDLVCGSDAEGSGGSGADVRYNNILDPDNNGGISFTTFANSWTSATTTGDFFTIEASAQTTGDLVNINVPTSNTTGDALEINRSGTKVAGINGFGTLDISSYNAVLNNNSAINFSAFSNTWTYSTGTNLWTSTASTTDFFTMENRTLTTGDAFTVKVDDGMTTGSAFQVLGGAASTTPIIFIDDSDVAVGTTACSGFALCAGGSGNTGIGTSTPTQKLDVVGSITTNADILSTDTGSIGWVIVDSTDNTACNSICTSGCVMGFENATGTAVTNTVSCDDATADECLCAGGS